MWMASTDRSGNDESDLTLMTTERYLGGDAIYPRIGVEVCAYGLGGWNYIGRVIAIDYAKETFTVGGLKARNPIAERVAVMRW